jgi:NAD-dependent dihydropyrimidine dehydrogenase PreA subunit
MARLTIDNMNVEVPDGSTILDAAGKLGIDIPTLCYYQPIGPLTTCMVCLVKVEGRDAFLPACSTRVADGMVVASGTDEVRAGRRRALELLLGDHLGDCMAPCHCLCPAGMNIPLMIRQIAAGRFDDALETAKRRIALPAVLGRICPAPCEKGCRRRQRDEPVAICLLKRFAADEGFRGRGGAGGFRSISTGKRVAVVGAGPAGLSGAYYLRRRGHSVCLFDEAAEPGGALRSAISPEVLPRDVLDAEIGMIRNSGVAFTQHVRVGRDVALAELREEYDAVLLAVGAPSAGELGITIDGGVIPVDRATYSTGEPGVFAAGGAVRKIRRLAVRACGDGREAAESMDQYLSGGQVAGPARAISVHIGALRDGEMDKFMAGASPAARVPPGGASGCFSAAEAVAEAARCLHCDCRKPLACKLRQYAQQYEARVGGYGQDRRTFECDLTHGTVVYEPGKCILCGTCVRICQRAGDKLAITCIGRGFNARVGVPFSGTLAEGLGSAAEECIAACPTGALAFKDDKRNRYGT